MTRSRLLVAALALPACLLLWACKPAAPPPQAPSSADAVALLDGEPLSRTLLDEMARQHTGTANPYDAPGATPAASAPPIDRQQLLQDLVDIELLARKARERGLDKQPALRAEGELQAKTILAQLMVREQIASLEVSDAELAAAYEERVPPHQFKLAQIVVADQPTAQAVIDQLRHGRPFAELARRHSIDADTRHKGGSLGSLMMDQMPTEMALAVRHLKPGEHTAEPVRTPNGWHVLLVQGLEPLPERPTLQTARAWLHPQIVYAKVEAQQKQWRREAQVQLTGSP